MGRSQRERRVSATEVKLWREVVKDAVPLPGRAFADDDAVVPAFEPAPRPPATALPAPVMPAPAIAPQPALEHGRAAGVDRRTAERLRRGQLEIEARLDLHGMTQAAAHAALNRFVASAYAAGRRCILVITGKGARDGTGVLRQAVPRWLNEAPLRPAIIAIARAQPRDGGDGALYVLLKRQR